MKIPTLQEMIGWLLRGEKTLEILAEEYDIDESDAEKLYKKLRLLSTRLRKVQAKTIALDKRTDKTPEQKKLLEFLEGALHENGITIYDHIYFLTRTAPNAKTIKENDRAEELRNPQDWMIDDHMGETEVIRGIEQALSWDDKLTDE